MKSLLADNALSPFHATIIHLILIGIPPRFGLIPLGLFPKTLGITSACSIFKYAPVECSPIEKFAIKEFGFRFVNHYELAFVACFIIKMIGKDSRKQSELRRFHWSLGVSSMLTTLFFAYMQVYGPAPLDDSLFARMVFYRLIAIVISWHSYVTGPSLEKDSPAAWSVPGASIMIGMAVNVLIIIAAFQALFSEGAAYYYALGPNDMDQITPIVTTSFIVGIMHSIVNVIILGSIRKIMSADELRVVCGYKVLLHILLPFFWYPEISRFVNINILTASVFRTFKLAVYGCGYLLAGKADYIGSILRSEKSN